jgi:hypothetical protein
MVSSRKRRWRTSGSWRERGRNKLNFKVYWEAILKRVWVTGVSMKLSIRVPLPPVYPHP